MKGYHDHGDDGAELRSLLRLVVLPCGLIFLGILMMAVFT